MYIMSLSAQFEDEIDNYANQLSAYNEEVTNYKDQLQAAKGQAVDFTKSLTTEIGVPLAVELVRVGASKVLGASDAALVSRLTGSAVKSATGGEGSLLSNLSDTARQSLTGVATEPEVSALSTAKQGIMSIVNKVRGGAEDAVASAEGAMGKAQATLTDAAESSLSSITKRVTSEAGDLVQSQVSRLNGLASENDITSALQSAYKSTSAAEDTSVFGDVELSNLASAVPRSGIPDLSLPFESAFESPLSKISLDAVPDAFSSLGSITGSLASASKFASGMVEPVAQSGLSSNMIARAFMGGKPDMASIDSPDSLIPTQDEALSMLTQQVRPVVTSDMLPEGAGELAGGFMGRLSSGVPDIAGLSETLSSTASTAVSGATEALSGAAGAITGATSAAAGAGETIGAAAAEAGTEVAAGAEAGPVGLVIGAAIGIGTFLFDMFHHHETKPPPPPAPAPVSVPSFQAGLATSN